MFILDFHPDTWNPAWSVATILAGLLSFMSETTPTYGSTESSTYEREQYAKKSLEFNLKNDTFRELFPEILEEIKLKLEMNNNKTKNTNGGLANGFENSSNGQGVGSNGGSNPNSDTWHSLCSNIIVLTVFGIFAVIVNHVIKNLNKE